MISELTEAMIVNGAVLASVLATDLGPARKIGKVRMLRPLLVAAAVSRCLSSGRSPAATASSLSWPASSRASWPASRRRR